MKSTASKTGSSIVPRVLGALFLTLFAIGAALPVAGAAASKHRGGPLITVKTASQARGSIVVHLRAGASLRRDLVRLNGHRVGAITPHRKGERAVVVLDRADHLRFGRNVLTVSARSRAGSKATVRRLVMIGHDAPLPGIRRPRRIVTGHVARLDARRTRSAHGGKLHFRWRVVRAPRGAKVVLHGARARRPRLIADVPGDYRVALTVSERPRVGDGTHHPTAARASTASSPCVVAGAASVTVDQLPTYGPIASLPISRLPKGALRVVGGRVSPEAEPETASSAEPGCATEVTEVAVEPDFAPIGAAIDTRAEVEETEGIRIAGSFYPFPSGAETAGARFILLDATNLELIRTENVNLSGPHRGVAAKLVEESAPEGYAIVVSSCRFAQCPGDAADSGAGFSAIETYVDGKLTGAVENQGQTLVPRAEQNLHGQLEGWLHQGLPTLSSEEPLFSYVAPEQIPFDTAATTTATSNTISVGGAEYPASLPQESSAGFEVLVLNAAREPVLGTPIAFGTYSGTNQSFARSQEEAMTTLLGNTGPSDTVLVQSIANPVPTTAAATRLATAMATIGADAWTFLNLQGSGAYAFVGNGTPTRNERPETATAETSEEEVTAGGGPKGAGSLHGLLTRNEESGLSPSIASATEKPNLEIAQVAYQPATEWPQTETPGKVEATTYLAEKLKLEGGENGEGLCYRPARPDFRSIYCDQSLSPTATQTKVESAPYPEGQSVSFSEAEFAEVKKELVLELADLEDVRTLFKGLTNPFLGERPEIGTQGVAGAIINAMPEVTRGNGAEANTATLFASFLDAGSLLPGGDLLGVISAALYIADEFSEEEAEPSPPVWKFQVRADEVGEKVEANLQATVAHLGALEDILVSDYGKLSTSADEAGAGWAVTNSGLLRAHQSIELGFRRWMWESILPAGFELFHFREVNPGEQDIVHCLTRRNSNWAPFEKAATQSIFFPIGHFENNGEPGYEGAYGLLAGPVSSTSSVPVSTGLAEKIFGTPKNGGAGLTEPELFQDAPFTTNEPQMIGNGGENENSGPGWCELRRF